MKITREFVLKVVCEYMFLHEDVVKSASRKREYVIARQIYCLLCRRYTKISLRRIADLLGSRDHTAAVHSINTITDLMSVDKSYSCIVAAIEEKLLVRPYEVRMIKLKRAA